MKLPHFYKKDEMFIQCQFVQRPLLICLLPFCEPPHEKSKIRKISCFQDEEKLQVYFESFKPPLN